MGIFGRLSISFSLVIAGCMNTVPLGDALEVPTALPPLRWSKSAASRSARSAILVFLTPDILALSETVEEGGSQRTGSVELLDVQSGGVRKTLSWSAPSSAPLFLSRAVVRLSEGRFLLQSWNSLKLFSPEGEVLKTRTFAVEDHRPDYNPSLTIHDHWDIGASPDGHVLLATLHRPGHPEAEEHWLSPETLEDIQVETADTAHCCDAVGHEQVVYSPSAPKLAPVLIRSKGDQPRPLCNKCFAAHAAFLDDKWIVLVLAGRLLIVSNEGEIKADENLGSKEDKVTEISIAPISRQIAFLLMPQYSRSTPGNYRICVYDSVLKKVTFQMQVPVRIRREPPWDEVITAPNIALSPDGKSLAILDDSMLRIYALSP